MSNIEQYQSAGADYSVDVLVKKYYPLVRKIALYMKKKLPSHIELDDLTQSGLVGLLEAYQKFKADKGATFETFVSVRIKGAMIDFLRKNSWLTRESSGACKKISDAISKIEQRDHVAATPESIAHELGLSMDDYTKLSQDAVVWNVVSLDDLDETKIKDKSEEDPFEINEKQQIKYHLKKLLKKLPEREQIILSLYYIEELSFKEIAQVFELTEARICQLHSQIILKVKNDFNKVFAMENL